MTAATVEPASVRRSDAMTLGGNGLASGKGMISVAQSRAAQEVQAAMVVAKNFPRDTIEAERRIVEACKRKGLAEQAMYAYKRGTSLVTGPSIRLAEAMAQNWGNLDFGIIELEQKKGESVVMAYAWDLETNTRQTKVFSVTHERHTKSGSYTLTDPRDIYEMVANNGARRVRACILGVIPGDIIDSALGQCEKTLAGKDEEPIVEKVKRMLEKFGELGVRAEHLEKNLGHKLDATTRSELVRLGKIYKSIDDGMSKPSDWFPDIAPPANTEAAAQRTADVQEKLKRPTATSDLPSENQAIEDGTEGEDDVSTWEAVKATVESLAQDQSVTPSEMESGLTRWLLKVGCKGKPEKTTEANRRELLSAVKAGRFVWADGSIVKE